MDKIGNLLKQKRLEMGLTVEEISEKTRLTIKHIKAIEEGDISYFRDDLSYLRFFLKAYCNVVGLDFEEMKPDLKLSIDDYTTSFTREAIIQHQAIEDGVKENANKLRKSSMNSNTQKNSKKARTRHKIDASLWSFIAIVVIVIIALLVAFVIYIQGSKNDEVDPSTQTPPIAEVPSKPEEPTPPPVVEEPIEEKELVITSISETQYVLENLKDQEAIDIEIYLGSNSSFRALVNDKQLSDPAQRTYQYKSILHVREKAEKDKKILLAFGFMKSNTIKVNGQEVALPASVVNKEGSVVIEFQVKGE